MQNPSNHVGPVDFLHQPISSGSIVTYVRSLRSPMELGIACYWEPGLLTVCKDEKEKYKVNLEGYNRMERVVVMPPSILSNSPDHQELARLSLRMLGPWQQKKVPQSIMSPITKWARSFEKKCGDFSKKKAYSKYNGSNDANGYFLEHNSGKKIIEGGFTTTHNGQTLRTRVDINSSRQVVAIYDGTTTVECFGNNLWSGSPHGPVFGIPDWFSQNEIYDVVTEAMQKVQNQ